MESISLLSLLGICSIEDLKTRRIRTTLVLIFGILGVLLHLIFGRISILSLLGGMAVGLVLLLISILSGERIGKGDGILVMVTGIYLGFQDNLILLWGSVTMMGIFCVGGLVTGRLKRSGEIPYVPFLLAGYVALLLLKEGGVYG